LPKPKGRFSRRRLPSPVAPLAAAGPVLARLLPVDRPPGPGAVGDDTTKRQCRPARPRADHRQGHARKFHYHCDRAQPRNSVPITEWLNRARHVGELERAVRFEVAV